MVDRTNTKKLTEGNMTQETKKLTGKGEKNPHKSAKQ